ncbi:putative signal peptide protein [Puccinia sorghi]|uniref:Putative signal peptide protein n=1 Tax=Puccinia sorghi TaxID=27349 RepID=A0A0L6UGM3_9BASI|nr:putative signal peptide protein [Puccinia sorghi]
MSFMGVVHPFRLFCVCPCILHTPSFPCEFPSFFVQSCLIYESLETLKKTIVCHINTLEKKKKTLWVGHTLQVFVKWQKKNCNDSQYSSLPFRAFDPLFLGLWFKSLIESVHHRIDPVEGWREPHDCNQTDTGLNVLPGQVTRTQSRSDIPAPFMRGTRGNKPINWVSLFDIITFISRLSQCIRGSCRKPGTYNLKRSEVLVAFWTVSKGGMILSQPLPAQHRCPESPQRTCPAYGHCRTGIMPSCKSTLTAVVLLLGVTRLDWAASVYCCPTCRSNGKTQISKAIIGQEVPCGALLYCVHGHVQGICTGHQRRLSMTCPTCPLNARLIPCDKMGEHTCSEAFFLLGGSTCDLPFFGSVTHWTSHRWSGWVAEPICSMQMGVTGVTGCQSHSLLVRLNALFDEDDSAYNRRSNFLKCGLILHQFVWVGVTKKLPLFIVSLSLHSCFRQSEKVADCCDLFATLEIGTSLSPPTLIISLRDTPEYPKKWTFCVILPRFTHWDTPSGTLVIIKAQKKNKQRQEHTTGGHNFCGSTMSCNFPGRRDRYGKGTGQGERRRKKVRNFHGGCFTISHVSKGGMIFNRRPPVRLAANIVTPAPTTHAPRSLLLCRTGSMPSCRSTLTAVVLLLGVTRLDWAESVYRCPTCRSNGKTQLCRAIMGNEVPCGANLYCVHGVVQGACTGKQRRFSIACPTCPLDVRLIPCDQMVGPPQNLCHNTAPCSRSYFLLTSCATKSAIPIAGPAASTPPPPPPCPGQSNQNSHHSLVTKALLSSHIIKRLCDDANCYSILEKQPKKEADYCNLKHSSNKNRIEIIDHQFKKKITIVNKRNCVWSNSPVHVRCFYANFIKLRLTLHIFYKMSPQSNHITQICESPLDTECHHIETSLSALEPCSCHQQLSGLSCVQSLSCTCHRSHPTINHIGSRTYLSLPRTNHNSPHVSIYTKCATLHYKFKYYTITSHPMQSPTWFDKPQYVKQQMTPLATIKSKYRLNAYKMSPKHSKKTMNFSKRIPQLIPASNSSNQFETFYFCTKASNYLFHLSWSFFAGGVRESTVELIHQVLVMPFRSSIFFFHNNNPLICLCSAIYASTLIQFVEGSFEPYPALISHYLQTNPQLFEWINFHLLACLEAQPSLLHPSWILMCFDPHFLSLSLSSNLYPFLFKLLYLSPHLRTSPCALRPAKSPSSTLGDTSLNIIILSSNHKGRALEKRLPIFSQTIPMTWRKSNLGLPTISQLSMGVVGPITIEKKNGELLSHTVNPQPTTHCTHLHTQQTQPTHIDSSSKEEKKRTGLQKKTCSISCS